MQQSLRPPYRCLRSSRGSPLSSPWFGVVVFARKLSAEGNEQSELEEEDKVRRRD